MIHRYDATLTELLENHFRSARALVARGND